MAAKLVFNISLIFALLGAPVFLAMAVWFRRNMGKPYLVWHVPEMVVVTIVFFISCLLLLIVGVSCFFSIWGYIDHLPVGSNIPPYFAQIGASCLLFMSGLMMIYAGLRKLMVQAVLEKGIMLNENFVLLPGAAEMITWDKIIDYYQQADYPNVVFHLILDNTNLRFRKISLRVPVFLKDDFQAYLDKKIFQHERRSGDNSRISRASFSEN